MSVTIEESPASTREDRQNSEYISSIILWGLPGRMTLKIHFDTETAIKWASAGLQKAEYDIEDSIALDFFRELSNLHAGNLRGMFEGQGILFRMSLPFIMVGDSEPALPSLQQKQIEGAGELQTLSWVLTDGGRPCKACRGEATFGVCVRKRSAFYRTRLWSHDAFGFSHRHCHWMYHGW